MNLTVKINRFIKRKLVTAVLVTASVAAFATLGDGGKKGKSSAGTTSGTAVTKGISLRSSFNYRGNHLFTSNQPKYITLNTTVTYQKGNSTYIVPLKKKVLLEKIRFNPSQGKF
jgi:hypothetical protein